MMATQEKARVKIEKQTSGCRARPDGLGPPPRSSAGAVGEEVGAFDRCDIGRTFRGDVCLLPAWNQRNGGTSLRTRERGAGFLPGWVPSPRASVRGRG